MRLLCVAGRGFERLHEAVIQEVPDRSNGAHALQASAAAYVVFAVRNANLYRLMFGANLGDPNKFPELQRAGERAFSLIVQGLQQSSGTADAQQADSQQDKREDPSDSVGVACWSWVHGLAMLLIDGRLGEPTIARARELTLRTTNMAWVGLRDLLAGEAG